MEPVDSLLHSQEPARSSMPNNPTSWISILILSYLSLGLPSSLFPSGFHTKTLHAPLFSPIPATYPAHLIPFLFYHPKSIWWRVLAGAWVWIPPGARMFLSVMCYQVQISASGWSLVQRSPTKFSVSERDHESSLMKRPWPTGSVAPW